MNRNGVIFDMDGVLVDSTAAHYEAWRLAGEREGVPYPRELFNRTFGMHNRQTIPLWLNRTVSDDEIERIAAYKEKLYRDIARRSLQPIPGVVALVRALADAGFQLAVGSSGPSANVTVALEVIGLTSYFKAISCGDEVKEGKPDPAIFLNAAKKLNLPPERCLVIEDAPPGIEAAHRAHMRVVAIATSRKAEELTHADLVIADFSELTTSRVAQLIAATTLGNASRS